MKNKDLKKRNLTKLKKSTFFDDEKLPEVKKDINEKLEKLNKEVVEGRKTIAENDRKIAEVGYEDYLKFVQLTRLRPI